MNLLEASVYVHLDRYIALHLGEQVIHLPWHDMRARQVAHYHGERIVVGVRAEAIAPTTPEAGGDVVHGRVRYLEHHGHETLAFVDIGAFGVPVDDLNGGAAMPGAISASRLARAAALFRRAPRSDRLSDAADAADVFAGPPGGHGGPANRMAHGGTTVLEAPGRHHRPPAEVAVRLAPYPGLRRGDSLSLAVRVDQLHFFDGRGQRIDVGWR